MQIFDKDPTITVQGNSPGLNMCALQSQSVLKEKQSFIALQMPFKLAVSSTNSEIDDGLYWRTLLPACKL